MAGSTKASSPVAVAAAGVGEARETLARWEAEAGTAAAELENLQARAGEEVLADPEASRSIARSMQELRDRLDVAGRTVDAARPRVAAAEQAYLLAEADALEAAHVVKARAALTKHQARTTELLRLLEEHEGRFVPEHEVLMERHVTGTHAEWELPVSARLEDELEAAEEPVRILRDLAAGRVPNAPVERYPTCVASPDAVVKAPIYLRSMQAAETELSRLDARLESLPRLLEDLRAEERELAAQTGPTPMIRQHPNDDPLVKVRRRIGGVEAELERLQAQRAQHPAGSKDQASV